MSLQARLEELTAAIGADIKTLQMDGAAAGVSFDNSTTGLAADNVQEAIDEIVGDIDAALAAILGDAP